MHELPEDLSQWPADPYLILGVAYGVLPRDLRRAYTRLIRTWKPEQHPEHFRRIREAYESILQYVQFFGSSSAEPPAEEPLATPREVTAEEGTRPPHRIRGLEDDLQDAWDLACHGQEAEAYARLLRLHDQHFGNEAVCLRLYWLLGVVPELDTQRSSCEWLAVGLKANGLTGPLRELYHRELQAQPEEALSPRCAALLDCPVRPGLLCELAEWRWQAASRTRNWDTIIANDLLVLRDQLLAEDEESWCRLLFAAVDLLAWGQAEFARNQVQWCRREIEHLEHLHVRLPYEMDRYEFLLELAGGWHVLRQQRFAPPLFTRLLSLSWARPLAEYRMLLLEVLDELAREPRRSLKLLDDVQSVSSAALAHFWQVLSALANQQGVPAEPRSQELLGRVVFDFLDRRHGHLYTGSFRADVLDFCIQESIAPEQVAHLVAGLPRYWITNEVHLAERLTGDWPLRCAWLAQGVFWK